MCCKLLFTLRGDQSAAELCKPESLLNLETWLKVYWSAAEKKPAEGIISFGIPFHCLILISPAALPTYGTSSLIQPPKISP